MDEDEEQLLIYINRSAYRVNILKSIGHGVKIPSVIAEESGILMSHISVQLRTLRDAGLVECVNPEFRKGRLYRLTDRALSVLDEVRHMPELRNRTKMYDDDEDSESSGGKSKKKRKSKKKKSKKKNSKKNSSKKTSSKKKDSKKTKSSSKKSKNDSNSPNAGE